MPKNDVKIVTETKETSLTDTALVTELYDRFVITVEGDYIQFRAKRGGFLTLVKIDSPVVNESDVYCNLELAPDGLEMLWA